MKVAVRWGCSVLLAGWSLLGVVGAAEPLDPPLELKWGDSPSWLVGFADRHGMDKNVRAPGKEPRLTILEVGPAKGPLPGHEASSIEARFMDGRLFEVAVHYTYPGRSSDFVKGRFLALKSGLTVRHGKFRLNGKKKPAVKDGISTSSEAYHLDAGEGRVLLLAVTEVKDMKRGDSAARFSVVYRNETILAEE
jgi:hypothetical protein